MKNWRNTATAIFAVVCIFLSFAACDVACARGDDDGTSAQTAQHHCILHCACHAMVMPSMISVGEFIRPADNRDFLSAEISDNSRLAPSAIFHPPRA